MFGASLAFSKAISSINVQSSSGMATLAFNLRDGLESNLLEVWILTRVATINECHRCPAGSHCRKPSMNEGKKQGLFGTQPAPENVHSGQPGFFVCPRTEPTTLKHYALEDYLGVSVPWQVQSIALMLRNDIDSCLLTNVRLDRHPQQAWTVTRHETVKTPTRLSTIILKWKRDGGSDALWIGRSPSGRSRMEVRHLRKDGSGGAFVTELAWAVLRTYRVGFNEGNDAASAVIAAVDTLEGVQAVNAAINPAVKRFLQNHNSLSSKASKSNKNYKITFTEVRDSNRLLGRIVHALETETTYFVAEDFF